ncbi:MAG: hypothetical protein CMK74_20215 [Pseudomonadales bacterium]|nr:hypothetical protein [Pseudomonadales bacterium]|tara:strand:+ start:619 stop:1005 length:387 start_codon:yes stop_codon:yes gene_type:complete
MTVEGEKEDVLGRDSQHLWPWERAKNDLPLLIRSKRLEDMELCLILWGEDYYRFAWASLAAQIGRFSRKRRKLLAYAEGCRVRRSLPLTAAASVADASVQQQRILLVKWQMRKLRRAFIRWERRPRLF